MGKHDYMKYDGRIEEPPYEEKNAPSSCTCGLHCSLPFHSWLRNQEQWVITVAQSDTVYQAMKLSYEANAEAHGRAVARTVQPLVGASGG